MINSSYISPSKSMSCDDNPSPSPSHSKKIFNISNVTNCNSSDKKTRDKNLQNIYAYDSASDGTCFFRSILAIQQNDPSWLEQRSLEEMYIWIDSKKDIFFNAIKDAINSLQLINEYNNTYQALNEQLDLMKVTLDALSEDLLVRAMTDRHFTLWHDKYIEAILNSYIPNQAFQSGIGAYLSDAIYAHLAEHLNAPISKTTYPHLERIENAALGIYHYYIVSDIPLFGNEYPSIHLNKVKKATLNPPNAVKVDSYAFQSSDGADFIRAILASQTNNADWINNKPLNEIYAWINNNSDIFLDAIYQAISEFGLDWIFTDEYDEAVDLFASQQFLNAMQGDKELGLFNSSKILQFAQHHGIHVEPAKIQAFVSSVILDLADHYHIDCNTEKLNSFRLDKKNELRLADECDFSSSVFLHKGQDMEGVQQPSQSNYQLVDAYIKYPIKGNTGLSRYRFSIHPKSDEKSSLYKGIIALRKETDEHLHDKSDVLTSRLSSLKGFNSNFEKALMKAIEQVTGHVLTQEESKKLRKHVYKNYFNEGKFNLIDIFNGILSSKYSALLPTELFSNENQKNINKVQKIFEQNLLQNLEFSVYTRDNINQGNKLANSLGFVLEADGSYSILTVTNFFDPEFQPIDKEIYEEDLKNNPTRNSARAYLDSQYGEQKIIESNTSQEDDLFQRDSGTTKRRHVDAAWLDICESEKKIIESKDKSKYKSRANLAEITRRDGLFSEHDSLQAGAEILASLLNGFNQGAEEAGYITHPVIPKRTNKSNKAQDVNALIHNALADYQEKNLNPSKNKPDQTEIFVQKKEVKNESKNTEKQKPVDNIKKTSDNLKSWDPLAFPEAQALPVYYPKTSAEHDKTRTEYDKWHQTNAHHSRKKRRADYLMTPDQIMNVRLEELADQITSQETANIQYALTTQLEDYGGDNPAKQRHLTIVGQIEALKQSNSLASMALTDSLDAMQMTLFERSADFRDAYAHYWSENEKTLKMQNAFHFHLDVEDYFPEGLSNYAFQQPSRNSADLEYKRNTVLAEIYNKQSLGQDLDYKKLGQVFANLDIDALSLGSSVRAESLVQLKIDWSTYLDTNPIAKAKYEQVATHLKARNIDLSNIQPQSNMQGVVLGRAASQAQYNMGYCQYYGTGMLLELQKGDLNSLLETTRVSETINKLATADPVFAYRLSNGLDTANNELQDLTFFDQTSGLQVRESSLEKWQTSFDSMLDAMDASDNGFRIRVESGASGQHAVHSIAVGQVNIEGQKMFVLIDANYGLIPCVDKGQLRTALHSSFSALIPDFEESIHVQGMKFRTLELSPENTEKIRQLKTAKNIGYDDLTKRTMADLSLQHFITEDPEWARFLPGTSQTRGSDLSSDLQAYKNPANLMSADSLDVLMAQARTTTPEKITTSDMSDVDVSQAIRPVVPRRRGSPAAPDGDGAPPARPQRPKKPAPEPDEGDQNGKVVLPEPDDGPPAIPAKPKKPNQPDPEEAPPRPANKPGKRPVPDPQQPEPDGVQPAAPPRKNKPVPAAPEPDAAPPAPPSRGKKPASAPYDPDDAPPLPQRPQRPAQPKPPDSADDAPPPAVPRRTKPRASKDKATVIGPQVLDEFVRISDADKGTFTTDPVRRNPLQTQSGDLLKDRQVISLDLREEVDLTKVTDENLGAKLLGIFAETSATDKAITISQDDNGDIKHSASSKQEASNTKVQSAEDSFKKVFGVNQQELVTSLESSRISKPTIEKFVSEELSAIPKYIIEELEIENHKIASQMGDFSSLVNELVAKQKIDTSEYEIDAKSSFGSDNKIVFKNIKFSGQAIEIELPSEITTRLTSLKSGIKLRLDSVVESIKSGQFADSLDVGLERASKGVGKVMGVAGKIMAIVNLQNLLEQTKHAETFDTVGKMHLGISLTDVLIDNVANAVGITNALVKTIIRPVAQLSAASQVTSGISTGASFLFNFVELGLYCYAYDHAENSLDQKLSEIAVAFALGRIALSTSSLVVCSAIPIASPFFMVLGFLVSYIQEAIQDKLLANYITNQEFKGWEAELDNIYQLLVEPSLSFNENENKLIVVSNKAPGLKLEVTESEIRLYKNDKHIKSDLLEGFKKNVSPYDLNIIIDDQVRMNDEVGPRKPYGRSRALDPFYELTARAFEDNKYRKELSTERYYDHKAEDTKARNTFIDSVSSNQQKKGTTNPKINYEIEQKRTVVDNMAHCLAGDEVLSQPLSLKLNHLNQEEIIDRKSDSIKHIYFQGHSPEITYSTNKCTRRDHNGALGWHYSQFVGRMDQCQAKDKRKGIIKPENQYYKSNRQSYVLVKPKNPNARETDFYRGKVAVFEYAVVGETWMGKASRWFADKDNKYWTLSFEKRKCNYIPHEVELEFQKNKYKLSSGGEDGFIFHFPADPLMQYLLESPNQKKHFGIKSPFTVTKHNIDKSNIPYYVELIADGSHNFYLYPNTELNFSEIAPAGEDKSGSINLLFSFELFEKYKKTNQVSGIVKNLANNQLVILPAEKPAVALKPWEISQREWLCKTKPEFGCFYDGSIKINLDASIERPVFFNINKQHTNTDTNEKTNYSYSLKAISKENNASGLILEMNSISEIKMGSLEETTQDAKNKIAELKSHLPNTNSERVEITGFDLLHSPYHKNIIEAEKNANQGKNPSGAFYQSQGWYFEDSTVTDEDKLNHIKNLADHEIFKKVGALAVSKIWRSNVSAEKKEIFKRMGLVGFTQVQYENIPTEFQPYFTSGDKATCFHFFDSQTKTMVKQFAGFEIRTWVNEDIEICPKENIPRKVIWGTQGTESYSCKPIHIAPPSRIDGVGEDRLIAIADLAESILNKGKRVKRDNFDINRDIFSEIYVKTESQLTDTNRELENKGSEQASPPLLIDLIGLTQKEEAGDIKRINALLDKDDNGLSLSLIPDDEIPLGIPKGETFVISMQKMSEEEKGLLSAEKKLLLQKEVDYRKQNNLPELQLLSVIVRSKVAETDLSTLSQAILTSPENALASRFVPNGRKVLNDKLITFIANDFKNKQLIVHLLEGIALSISYDLTKVTFLGLSEDYLTKNEVSINDEKAINEAYQNLKVRYPDMKQSYLRLQQATSSEPAVYVNTETDKIIYVPSIAAENIALSNELFIMSENAEGEVLVQDLKSKSVFSLSNPYTKDSSAAKLLFIYKYLAEGKNNFLYLALDEARRQNTSTNQHFTLPYIDKENLVLLPTQALSASNPIDVLINSQQALKSITLANSGGIPDYKVQAVNLVIENTAKTSELKATVFKQTVKQTADAKKGTDEEEVQYHLAFTLENPGQTPLTIRLEKPFTTNTTLSTAFNNTILINGEAQTTAQLQAIINAATMIDLDQKQKKDDVQQKGAVSVNGVNFLPQNTNTTTSSEETGNLKF